MERFPNSRILAVSNSRRQGNFILGRAATQGLNQVEVATADMNEFVPRRSFDRIVSVEMFEHLRNWPQFLERLSGWHNLGANSSFTSLATGSLPTCLRPGEAQTGWDENSSPGV